jgi:hypothetical protein
VGFRPACLKRHRFFGEQVMQDRRLFLAMFVAAAISGFLFAAEPAQAETGFIQ